MAGKNPTNQAAKAAHALRRERALELRVAGLSFAQIGRELGVSGDTASRYTREALANVAKRTDDNAGHLQALELERLDKLQRSAERVLAKRHLRINSGMVVRNADPATGQLVEIEDDGPTLAAIDRLLHIAERRAKLLGLDAPQQVEQSGITEVVVHYADSNEGRPHSR